MQQDILKELARQAIHRVEIVDRSGRELHAVLNEKSPKKLTTPPRGISMREAVAICTWSRLMMPAYLAMTLVEERDGNLDPSDRTLVEPSAHPSACHDRDFPRISLVRAAKWSSHAGKQLKANDGRSCNTPLGKDAAERNRVETSRASYACTCNRSREFSLRAADAA